MRLSPHTAQALKRRREAPGGQRGRGENASQGEPWWRCSGRLVPPARVTFGEIACVLRVVGISVAANLHMASDRDGRHSKERDRSICEHPVAAVPAGIVSVLHPLSALPGMSSFCPVPCHAPDRVVDVAEDVLAQSGKGRALRLTPPLRTRRASFPAPGSSLDKAP